MNNHRKGARRWWWCRGEKRKESTTCGLQESYGESSTEAQPGSRARIVRLVSRVVTGKIREGAGKGEETVGEEEGICADERKFARALRPALESLCVGGENTRLAARP